MTWEYRGLQGVTGHYKGLQRVIDKRFLLCKIEPEKVFGDVLVRKQAYLDNINMELKRRQNFLTF